MKTKQNYKNNNDGGKRISGKRIFPAYIMSALVIMTALAFMINAPAAEAAGGSWGGDGTTVATAFTIDDAADLALLATNVNGGTNYSGMFFLLTADIDLAGFDAGSGLGWMPIGNSTNRFEGSFDGGSHVIKNLTINRTTTNYIGLFGYLGSGSEIKGLGIEGGTVTGQDYVGGVAGRNEGRIENCYNTGAVIGRDNIGGVAGGAGIGTVMNCYNTGAVTGTDQVGGVIGYKISSGTVGDCYNTGAVRGTGNYVGGVVGWNDSGTVTDCYNAGTVANNDYTGGVAGRNDGTITNCYNIGAVTGTGDYVGGVAGVNASAGTVGNCYNTGTVTGTGSYVGGVVGTNQNAVDNSYNTGAVTGSYVGGTVGNNNGTIGNCYSAGAVIGSNAGGVAGRNGGTITNCYYNKDIYLGAGVGVGTDTTTDRTTVQMTASGFNVSVGTAFDMPTTYGTSDGCATSFYPELAVFTAAPAGSFAREASKISAAATGSCTLGVNEEYFAHGDGLSDTTPYQIYTAKQLNHVRQHLTGEYFILMNDINLGGFDAGDSDGWMPIGDSTTPFVGIFDGNGNKVQNLRINRVSADYVGLFGYVSTNGRVSDLGVVGGTVTGNNFVGSVVGYNNIDGLVDYCYNAAAVNGNNDIGGVVGHNKGVVEYCYNAAAVNGNNGIGGAVGMTDANGIVDNCYNTGKITGNDNIGGVTGETAAGGVVKNSYNTGTVIGINEIGGVAGYTEGEITYCYNTGAVNGTGYYVGGVAGYNSYTLTYCYNTGEVNGIDYVAGVAGYNSYTLTYCYNTGEVNGIDYVAGVAGSSNGTILDCYNTGAVGGDDSVGGAVGENNNGTVEECYNIGTVIGNTNVGGVAGGNYGIVTECYNTGAVTGNGYNVGGVAGLNSHIVEHCYNTGSVDGDESVGGAVGYNINVGTVEKSYAAGMVTGNIVIGGAVGYNIGTIANCYFDADNYPGDGVGAGTGTAVGLSTAQMTDANVLTTGGMSGLGTAVFEKRATDTVTDFCYYPELDVFYSSSDPDALAASKASVEVARRAPQFNGATLTYGDLLEDAVLDSEFSDPVTGVDVYGTIVWTNGNTTYPIVADSGSNPFFYTFTPDYGDLYISLTGVSVTITVDPAVLSVLPDNGQGKKVGGADPVLTHNPILGWVSALGDSDSLLSGYIGRDPGETPGTYTYTTGTLSAVNYAFVIAGAEVFTISSVSSGSYVITASSDAASSISPSGKVAAAGGESKTFTFSANAGYHISSVIVDAVPLTAAQIDQGSYTFTNVYSNHTIEVRSAPGQNTTGIILTISISGGGHAEYSINAAPFERYVSPVNNLPLGANVVIRATADDGYRFDKWETPSAKSTSEVVFDDVTSSLNLKLSFAKEGGDNTILWIVIAIVILVILFLLALFVLRGRRKEDGI